MRDTIYAPERFDIPIPTVGDHIFSVSDGAVMASVGPQASTEINEVIHRNGHTTYFTTDGASFRVATGARIIWEKHENAL